jgi:hypothetical protein
MVNCSDTGGKLFAASFKGKVARDGFLAYSILPQCPFTGKFF